ncbi:trypsin-like peptidase domain-containing protein [Myxosarcina sp. GI1]|uniref:trypsin-like peptidase domain-containing protein n=1 Tax=Myxosarcina sp. GI1 TaxID=1541065 RepID=UPI000689D588|nr:trypsin-like peptidase domain-containing protein [Myxosarcina sp. GI1]
MVAATPQEIARQITVQIVGNSNRGSGVIVSREDNTFSVLTNAHVVNQTGNYRAITADGIAHQISDRTLIPNLDLALLTFTSSNNYSVAAIDNTIPSVGETIYVAGWPRSGGSLRQPIFKVTSGEIRQPNLSLPLGYSLNYTNLVRAGMSGGAILNAEGKLIGINGLVRLEASGARAISSGIAIDAYLRWHGSKANTATDLSVTIAEPNLPNNSNYNLSQKISLPKGGVNALAYHNASQTLISGSSAGIIAVWQTATEEQLVSWQAHSSVNAIAVSADGKVLASGGDDGTIALWDLTELRSSNKVSLTQPQLIRTLQGHKGAITSLVFSADGNLFSSSWDKTVRQWQIESGKAIKDFIGHTQIVNAIALSDDGKILASGGQDKTIRLWDVATGKLRSTLNGHSLAILSLDISADNKILVSGSGDSAIKLWNLNTNKLIDTLQGHTDGVWQVAISSDLQTLISGSWDKTIKVWNLKTSTLQNTLVEHQDYISALAISSDGKMFVSGDWQGRICWWQKL